MYGFSYIIYMTFFAAYLIKELGMTPAKAGGLWALVGGLSILCGVIWGGLSDYLGRAKGAALAYLILTVSYLLFALIPSAPGYYLSAVFFGLSAWSIPDYHGRHGRRYRRAQTGSGRSRFCHPLFRRRAGYRALDRRLPGGPDPVLHRPFLLAAAVSLLGGLLALGLKPAVQKR